MEFQSSIVGFNIVLVIYNLESIADINTVDLRKEWSMYIEAKSIINTLLEAEVKEAESLCNVVNENVSNSIVESEMTNTSISVFYRFLDLIAKTLSSCRSRLLISMRESLLSYTVPLSYVDRLVKCSKYFDSKMIMNNYIQTFDENEIKDLIKKQASDDSIMAYFNEMINPWDAVEIRIRNNTKYIEDIDSIITAVESSISDFEIVNKFNRYRLYQKDLNKRGEDLIRYETLGSILKEIQEIILGYENIFNGEAFKKDRVDYKIVMLKYNEVLEHLKLDKSFGKIVDLDQLNELKEHSKAIVKRLKEQLYLSREKNHRLYFVSDENILRVMNDSRHIKNILKEIFNIGSIIEEEGLFKGIVSDESTSLTETIWFKGPVRMDQDIHSVIEEFHNALSGALERYFERSIRGQIVEKEDSNDGSMNYSNEGTRRQALDLKDSNDDGTVYSNKPDLRENHSISMLDELIQDYLFFNSDGTKMPSNYSRKPLSGSRPCIPISFHCIPSQNFKMVFCMPGQ